jgi:hypothetical protein
MGVGTAKGKTPGLTPIENWVSENNAYRRSRRTTSLGVIRTCEYLIPNLAAHPILLGRASSLGVL